MSKRVTFTLNVYCSPIFSCKKHAPLPFFNSLFFQSTATQLGLAAHASWHSWCVFSCACIEPPGAPRLSVLIHKGGQMLTFDDDVVVPLSSVPDQHTVRYRVNTGTEYLSGSRIAQRLFIQWSEKLYDGRRLTGNYELRNHGYHQSASWVLVSSSLKFITNVTRLVRVCIIVT